MPRNQADSAWKDLLNNYLKDFIDYCFPTLSEKILWDRKWISLDSEFQAITKGESGKRLADKLFKVYRKDGEEQWILIHAEIQAEPDIEFPHRMFTYHYRIYDRFQKPVVSCAILTDDQKDWRPSDYRIEFAGSYLSAGFLVVKIMDYLDKKNELEISDNPFASAILIQLEALKNRRSSQDQRKKMKFLLTKRLYDKKFSKKDVLCLYQFLDWLVGLPELLELEYLQDIHKLEEVKNMPYITFAERYGMQIGIEKGMKEGMQRGLERGLEQGLERGLERGMKQEKVTIASRLLTENVESTFIAKITGLPLADIEKLKQSVVEVSVSY